MAWPTRIFLSRAGTTFAILALGLGGGHLIAPSIFSGTSAQDQATPSQKQASSEPLPAVRVVYPSSAEPALQATAAAVPTESAPVSRTQSAVPLTAPNAATPVVSPQIEERSKTRRELRAERRQHYAERRARRHQHQLVSTDQREPETMAFDGDTAPPRTGVFGN
jgi:hypothetical protein